jgi:hypothetical protein
MKSTHQSMSRPHCMWKRSKEPTQEPEQLEEDIEQMESDTSRGKGPQQEEPDHGFHAVGPRARNQSMKQSKRSYQRVGYHPHKGKIR